MPASLSLPLRRLPSFLPPLRFGVEGTALTSVWQLCACQRCARL